MIESANLQGLLAFVHAVEAGSFTRAANRLHLTKSAVGKAVAQLEGRLGIRLLNRTTRRLNLTPEGEAYYEACVRALGELDAAQSLLASRRERPSGRLRIDLPMAFGRRCAVPVLFDLIGRYPELDVEMSFNDRRVDLIEEGFDLTIRFGPLDDTPSLKARRLFAQRSTMFAAPGYLNARGRPTSLDELAGHALIAYGRDGIIAPWYLRDTEGRPRVMRPRGRLVIGHGEPLLDAAVAGCGIAYLPDWLVHEHLARGELEVVLDHPWHESAEVHALWPATRTLAPKIRVVVDALIAAFAAAPWRDLGTASPG